MPAPIRSFSNERDMAPQMTISTPRRDNILVLSRRARPVKSMDSLPVSRCPDISKMVALAATSKTGEIRPCQWEIATLMTLGEQQVCQGGRVMDSISRIEGTCHKDGVEIFEH